MSGFDLFKEMHNRKFGIPVVFMSALEEAHISSFSHKPPGFRFLRKPFRVGALLDAIDQATV
jgi:FixJ family two-component response regulator